MQRCLQLATFGAGHVAPNPMVGAVIVCEDKIIGEGWHKSFGEAHAEVNAIDAVQDKSKLTKSTLYVNLEPCSHYGKTPPCAELIIASKIPRVAVAMVDPNPKVAGTGIQKLRDAGVEVIVGVLENEATLLNRRFLCWVNKHRPYLILKWAQTQNGYLGPDPSKVNKEDFEQLRHITGKLVQKMVHRERTREAAILVGTNTALNDNPALNAREWPGRSPLRIVLDLKLRLPHSLKLFDQSLLTWIINTVKSGDEGNNHFIKVDAVNWQQDLLEHLTAAGLQSLIIEGGAITLQSFLQKGLWDEAQVFYSPIHLPEGIEAPRVSGRLVETDELDNVLFKRYFRE